MKTGFLTIALLAALSACNRAPTSNVAGNQAAGLPLPPERPTNVTAPTQEAQQTGMPPGLDCVRNRLSPEERRATMAVAVDQGTPDDPRAQALIRAVEACGDELSWSPQKRRLASAFSISAAGAAGVREELGRSGIRIEELDPTILADRELMTAAENGRFGGEVGQGFAARHLDEIQRIARGQSLEGQIGTRIGNYLGFRALSETLARRFGQES